VRSSARQVFRLGRPLRFVQVTIVFIFNGILAFASGFLSDTLTAVVDVDSIIRRNNGAQPDSNSRQT